MCAGSWEVCTYRDTVREQLKLLSGAGVVRVWCCVTKAYVFGIHRLCVGCVRAPTCGSVCVNR